jgi:hypothetical protein
MGGAHRYSNLADFVLLKIPPDATPQTEWRWCHKCTGLVFRGNGVAGPCPAGGDHDDTGSGNYVLKSGNADASSQDNWRWCRKCQSLTYAGNRDLGSCAGGGQHDHTGSGNYVVVTHPDFTGQVQWRFCSKCQGLVFIGSGDYGPCPGGGVHAPGAGDYALQLVRSHEPVNTLLGTPGDSRKINLTWSLPVPPLEQGTDSMRAVEIWETGLILGDRLVTTVASPPDFRTVVDLWGDLFVGETHSFYAIVQNNVGRSGRSAIARSATGVGSPPPPPPSPRPRVQLQFVLSGDWQTFITPAPGQVYVAAAPASVDLASAPHYPLMFSAAVGGWTGSVPASAGPAGSWHFKGHIRGVDARGADTGDLWSPEYGVDWSAASPAAYFTFDDTGHSGDLEWSPTATIRSS